MKFESQHRNINKAFDDNIDAALANIYGAVDDNHARMAVDDLKVLVEAKKMYNEEHDERTQFIKQKAGFPVFTAAGVVMIVGGLVAGYINSTVSYTMAACGIFIILYQIVLKFYFLKKY